MTAGGSLQPGARGRLPLDREEGVGPSEACEDSVGRLAGAQQTAGHKGPSQAFQLTSAPRRAGPEAPGGDGAFDNECFLDVDFSLKNSSE